LAWPQPGSSCRFLRSATGRWGTSRGAVDGGLDRINSRGSEPCFLRLQLSYFGTSRLRRSPGDQAAHDSEPGCGGNRSSQRSKWSRYSRQGLGQDRAYKRHRCPYCFGETFPGCHKSRSGGSTRKRARLASAGFDRSVVAFISWPFCSSIVTRRFATPPHSVWSVTQP
jgi:hypothetical protein